MSVWLCLAFVLDHGFHFLIADTHTGKKKPDIMFMFQDEIEDCLKKHVQDAPEEFISELAEYLIKQV